MSKNIEHGFIPQSISHISKRSNNPQDFVQQIRELNNHIQGKNIIAEVFKKKQNHLFNSDSRTYQIMNNQSIKQDPNQQSQQKNQQDFHQHYLQKQQFSLQQHEKQQKKLLEKISQIVLNNQDNLLYNEKRKDQYLQAQNLPIQNQTKYNQRQQQKKFKGKDQQLDIRFEYKRDENSKIIQNQGHNARQLKIMKHKQESNLQFLATQIKQILSYNKYFLLQVQKMETRRKIAQTQIQIRKLKIGMRNHAFTKTINYTSPIKKHNDFLIVKSPKKVDLKMLQTHKYLLQKINQLNIKSSQFQNKLNMLDQYYEYLKLKESISNNKSSNEKSNINLSHSRSTSKSRTFYFDRKSINSTIKSPQKIGISLKSIQQNQKTNKFKQEQDISQLTQKSVLFLKRQALKNSLFDIEHFFMNKQNRLLSQNDILKKQIQIINSQISSCQIQQNIWKDRVKYENQLKKQDQQKKKRKRLFQFKSQPKNTTFMNQLRSSKTPNKNNFNFTFKAVDFNQNLQKKNVSLRQLNNKIKLNRQNLQNLNTSRNSLSIKLKKSKSEKVIFQNDNNIAIQNSSKKGTIKTQQSLDRNSINISAQNEYYNYQNL